MNMKVTIYTVLNSIWDRDSGSWIDSFDPQGYTDLEDAISFCEHHSGKKIISRDLPIIVRFSIGSDHEKYEIDKMEVQGDWTKILRQIESSS